MNKILAIARITVRSALRSRVVITLLLLLLLMIFGLPITVKGDGTIAGHVKLVLHYTLGMVGFLLAIVTAWVGCAAVSTEVQDRQIHLIVTKPVHAFQIWVGKWFGILVLDLLLLLFAGAVSYGLLLWTTRPAALNAEQQRELKEEIFVARQTIMPLPEDVDERAAELLAQRRASGELPAEMSDEAAFDGIREALLVQAHSVGPGETKHWVFDLPRAMDAKHPLFLKLQFSASSGFSVPVEGVWTVGTPDNPTAFQTEQYSTARLPDAVRIPASAAADGNQLVVRYTNTDPDPVTVIFSHKDGLRLLVYEGGFLTNYLRALLLMYFQLAFLAAVGLAAGTSLSLPVAVFVSGWLLLLINMGAHLQMMSEQTTYFAKHAHGHAPVEADPIFWDHVFRFVYRVLGTIVRPLQTSNSLELLTSGELISWSVVAGSFAVRMIIYAGILALVSSWCLKRREIALPV